MKKSRAPITNPSLELEILTLQKTCQVVNSPRSLCIWLLAEHREWKQLIDLGINPNHYTSSDAFAQDYLVTVMVQKSPNIPLGVDRKQVAVASFHEAEQMCADTSTRLFQTDRRPEWYPGFKRHIKDILGPWKKALPRIEEGFSFGPGATLSVRGRGSSLSQKYDGEIQLTRSLIPFFRSILGETWWQHQNRTHVVADGNRFSTVPKNAKTDRGICVEPDLNIYVQKGIGKYIRKRLKAFGVDLDDQSGNQKLAQRAYRDRLATIDLSMASDTVSRGLVRDALPMPWVSLLELARSPRTYIEGEWRVNEKFSSMGNGYTFELESLIFSALVMSIVDEASWGDIGIYGDDIVVPAQYANQLIEGLEYLGFKPNTSKSFLAGNFFESCGSHFFKGDDVKPFYLKGESDIKDLPYVVQVANKVRKFASQMMYGVGCDVRFYALWKLLYNRCGIWKQYTVPLSMGDSGLLVSEKEAYKPRKPQQGEPWVCKIKTIQFVPRKRDKRSMGVLLAGLASIGAGAALFTYGREPIRGFLRKPRARWTAVYSWSEGFDWLF